jgi:hypothetical protein
MKNLSWQDRMLKAITKITKARRWTFGDNNPYFERVWNVIMNPKILTKQQCKEECKKHGYR